MKLKIIKIVTIVLISISIFSCASHRPKTINLSMKQNNYLTTYDALRRGNMLSIDKDGKIDKILSEVQPDVAMTNALEFTSKLDSNEKFTAEQVTKITESLTVLGERTAAVNILRDALYRLEEHCINSKDCGKEYWARFDSILSVVKDIQMASQSKSKEKEAEANYKSMIEYKSLSEDDKKKFGL